MANAVATTQQQTGGLHLMQFMAQRYALEEEQFTRTVRATCGLAQATPEQFAAFVIVCKEYNLNPILREIYAFPSRAGGVVPIVSIDGWVNLVNSHPQCDGFEFEDHHDERGALESITCRMHRKDRKFPVSVTEYLAECKRATDPWKMEHRMLRHKALIQAARYAFGFAGIYDEDEGRVIANAEPNSEPRRPPPASPPSVPAIEHQSAAAEPAKAEAVSPKPADEQRPTQQPTQSQTALDAASAAPYIQTINGQSTVETLTSWYKAHKAEFEPEVMPDAVFQLVATAYKARKRALTKQAKDNISTGVSDADKPDATKAAPKVKGAGKAPDVTDPADYENFVAWCNRTMDEAKEIDVLESFFNGFVEDNRKHLMPPDYDGLMEVYQRNEKRLHD